MGNFDQKVNKFIEIFWEQNGCNKVIQGLENTLMIAVAGLIIGIIIGTLIATVRVLPKYKTLPRVLNAVTMNEINVRLYILRNHYIEVYGEDPWNQTTDSGKTVAEEAKATLEDEIIRAELCMEHASELGINVTDEIKAMCLDDAQKFLDDIGPEISAEFGLTLAAEQNVNIKYEVVTAVTNVLSDQARETLLADEANQSLSDADLELKISESVQAQFDAWKEAAQVDYSDVWAQIVVGSVG